MRDDTLFQSYAETKSCAQPIHMASIPLQAGKCVALVDDYATQCVVVYVMDMFHLLAV